MPLAAAFVVFVQVADFQLLEWDDRVNIRDNPHLAPLGSDNLSYFWKQPYAGLYIPLTYNVLMVEAAAAAQPPSTGPDRFRPGVFHVGNLALHLINISLVFVLLRLFIGREGPAAMAATLFAIHPLVVETVAWATEIKGLLCAMFSFFALWQYVLSSEQEPITRVAGHWPASSTRRRRWHFAFATAAFVLAFLSKPAAAAIPLVALILEWTILRNRGRTIAWRLGPWFLLSAVILIATKRLQADEAIAAYKPELWLRPFVALDSLAFYLWKLVWPLRLGPDYGRSPLVLIRSGWLYGTWIVPLGIFLVAALLPNRRIWLASLGVFCAALAPVLGLVPFGFQDLSTVADRYAYFGLWGIALGFGWCLATHWRRHWQVPGFALLIIFAGLAHRQTTYWRDDFTLFSHCLEQINSQSFVALNNVGVAIEKSARNKPAAERLAKLRQAADYYRRAADMAPQFDDPHQRLAFVLAQLGRFDESVAAFQEFLKLRPNSPTGHANLGNIYLRVGQYDRAMAEYRRATELDGNYVNAWIGLGAANLQREDFEAAHAAYRRALVIDPSSERAQHGLRLAATKTKPQS